MGEWRRLAADGALRGAAQIASFHLRISPLLRARTTMGAGQGDAFSDGPGVAHQNSVAASMVAALGFSGASAQQPH